MMTELEYEDLDGLDIMKVNLAKKMHEKHLENKV